MTPTSSSVPPIEVRNLTKTFGALRAVDGLDLLVEPGTVHGFLGPNGAGKSTTLRVLLGLYRAASGDVRVLELDPAAEPAEVARRVSYVPGDVALWPNLTGAQVLDALAGLRGARDEERERMLIEHFALDVTKPVRSYSTGNRQKVLLVAAFAAPTDLLVLDEPTAGLDPLMETVFAECVEEAVAAGRTVLLSSHLLAEVERLCSHVTIIKDGRAVESGTLADLRHLAAVEVTVGGRVGEDLERKLRDLQLSPAGTAADPGRRAPVDVRRRDRLVLQIDRDDVPSALRLLADDGRGDVTVTPASLEALFLRHYQVDPR